MNLAVTAIGRDRPGIVAGITAVLLEMDGNVDDSQMSILHGQFAVMLIVSVPDDASSDELSARLDEAGREFGLAAITVSPIESLERGPQATHVLTVYGADKPGIVHGVAENLAARQVNITDLRTRRTGTENEPVYTLMMELAIPGEGSARADTATALNNYGADHDVEVNLTELDAQSL
ncbi:MAG: amino acid-binding protein [Solirubrobacterales bacterium]|nr:amino acid-binding protein [Solirubrobacterales bacterium]